MGKSADAYRVLVGKLKGKNHLAHPGIDGRILNWIFRKWEAWSALIWLRTGTGGRLL
jgi:hypothetical protein